MATRPPTKVHLIPDDYHLLHVGRLADKRLFWIDGQLHYRDGATTDFLCSYVFNPDGRLLAHEIESLGTRVNHADDQARENAALARHFAVLKGPVATRIQVRPFQVEKYGLTFGLVPRQLDGDKWRVEAMPGNTISFYSPWHEGMYDT